MRELDGVWELFTDAEKPHTLKKAVCKHCMNEVSYNKKSERVKEHLSQCKQFMRFYPSGSEDIPEFLKEDKYKKRRISSSSSNGGTLRGHFCPELKKHELELFHRKMALHYYITGTSFARIEQSELLQALQILRADVTLPSRKDLAGKLLDDCYKDLKSKVCFTSSYLQIDG